MLTKNQDIKVHDELIQNKDNLCAQFESGNPFFSNSDVEFSIEKSDLSKGVDFCSVGQQTVLTDSSEKILRSDLEASLKKAEKYPHNPDIFATVANYYLRLGEIEDAISSFTKALSLSPNHFRSLAGLAQCYSVQGDITKAIKTYLDILEIRNNDLISLLNLANLYLLNNDPENSLTFLKQALSIDKHNPFLLNNIALIKLTQKKYGEAISLLRKAQEINVNDPAIYNNIGIAYIANRNFRKAINSFYQAYLLDRNSREIIYNLARAYQEISNHDKVINLLISYLKYNPNEIDLRNTLAWSYFRQGIYQECLRQLYIVISQIDINDHYNYYILTNNIAVVYIHLGQLDRAKQLLKECVESDNNQNILSYVNLLDIYFYQNQLKNAKELLDKAIDYFPNDPTLISYLGDYYTRIEDFQNSERCYLNVLQYHPNFWPAILGLAWLKTDFLNDTDEAISLLEHALKFNKGNRALINNYAYSLIISGETNKAKQVLQKHFDTSNPQMNATKGLLLIKEGLIEEGTRFYNRAIKLCGSNKDLADKVSQKKFLELARYYAEHDNHKRAKELLKKGIKISSNETYYKTHLINLLDKLNKNKQ